MLAEAITQYLCATNIPDGRSEGNEEGCIVGCKDGYEDGSLVAPTLKAFKCENTDNERKRAEGDDKDKGS